MTPIETGLLGIVLMLVLFLLRVPVAFAMGIAGLVGFAYVASWDKAMALAARDFYEQFSSYSLSAITMFTLMGAYAFISGIGERLYRSAHVLVGHIRGGLAIATILASAGFAAICGSTTASSATLGRIALPEMKKYRYNQSFATGCVASGGTLGILIPPSTIFIIYGLLTEQSIGKLFVAGILPGLVLTGFFALTCYLICLINPKAGPPSPPSSWSQRVRASGGMIESLGLFLLVIGGLFLGWFSPTQAGGIGAAAALIIGLVRRNVKTNNLFEGTLDGLLTATMILTVVAGATLFGHFLTITTIPFVLADWVESLPLSPPAIMAVIVIIYFIGGCFVDAIPLITLLTPVLFPVVLRLGYDPIWFGVLTVLVSQMGVITPPVGVNVYVIKGIAREVPLGEIFRGTYPFLAAIVACIAVLIAFPKLALILPALME
ncbi:MAG: TRAP transporter large permease [Moorellales bacterium]